MYSQWSSEWPIPKGVGVFFNIGLVFFHIGELLFFFFFNIGLVFFHIGELVFFNNSFCCVRCLKTPINGWKKCFFNIGSLRECFEG